jgi:hypothetical protein
MGKTVRLSIEGIAFPCWLSRQVVRRRVFNPAAKSRSTGDSRCFRLIPRTRAVPRHNFASKTGDSTPDAPFSDDRK